MSIPQLLHVGALAAIVRALKLAREGPGSAASCVPEVGSATGAAIAPASPFAISPDLMYSGEINFQPIHRAM